MTTNNTTLAAALIKAQGAAQAVHKDGENQYHRYKYASAEAIIAEARAALTASGLGVLTLGWQVLPENRMQVVYRLVHASGESMDFHPCETTIVPEKGRPQDKAEATALTYSLGYFLRGLLLLPRVEATEEADARDDRGDAAPAAAESSPAGGEQKRDWKAFTDDVVHKLEGANTSEMITAIAKSVHLAKPPKQFRDIIAGAYTRKVAALSAAEQRSA